MYIIFIDECVYKYFKNLFFQVDNEIDDVFFDYV